METTMETTVETTSNSSFTPLKCCIATSLDGYIARADGSVDWLPEPHAGDDMGMGEFMASVDTILMGRETYQISVKLMNEHLGGNNPYAEQQCYVLSRSLNQQDLVFGTRVEGAVRDIVESLKAEKRRGIWLMGGGDVLCQCLQEHLVDEFFIAVIPVLLGEGVRLFPPSYPQTQLQLMRSVGYENGVVALYYQVERSSAMVATQYFSALSVQS